MFHKRDENTAPSTERALVCKLWTAGTFILFYITPAGSHYPTGHPLHRRPIWNPYLKHSLESRGSPCCLPTGCAVWIEFCFSGIKKTRCNALLVFRRHIKTYELLIISFRMCVTGPWRKLLDKPAGHAKRQNSGFSARTWLLITLVDYFNWLIVKQFCSACSTC